jgi:hypothetical protein
MSKDSTLFTEFGKNLFLFWQSSLYSPMICHCIYSPLSDETLLVWKTVYYH